MGRITAVEHMTLDGVMQSPGRADEDTRGGFGLGGWAQPFSDPVQAEAMGEHLAGAPGALLLGRRTYQDFAGYWPHQTGNPFTEVLDKTQKYVASGTLTEPLPWQNSTLLPVDAISAIAELRRDLDLVVLGSGDLLRSLMRHDLVDEYLLLINPTVVGTGRRLFDGVELGDLRLVASTPTTTGVIIATYQPG
ncbi:dihydrofolate reductase family protein [Nocardia sp. NPDC051052]|uniref:dihydrofolate reductase family protein n=1 Tax=Nocardia sp. NPDC051052 TaxID=3364322 RepID=UPI00379B2F99